eukprot:TRINITY_DN5654_c0_g1_i1.p1 TRINITY_DN5654_c0_g1~~TRINITY_DN5654_c0_g1_i1.p1  ORF type:complete len:128 (+),score=34.57 TRINITY_DN5654_c0_g1_i1:3-386(+)
MNEKSTNITNTDPNNTNTNTDNPLNETLGDADWEVFQLLPFLLDVLDAMRENEKKNTAEPTKNFLKTVNLLLNRIETCKVMLDKLPGTEYNKQEKQLLYEELCRKHEEKCKLIAKYKTLPVFNNLKK